jgi:hypothetical protein
MYRFDHTFVFFVVGARSSIGSFVSAARAGARATFGADSDGLSGPVSTLGIAAGDHQTLNFRRRRLGARRPAANFKPEA